MFTEELSKVDWCDDVEMAWDRFKWNLAPYKEIRIKQRTEPWMTDSILKIIKERNDSFKEKGIRIQINEVRDKIKEATKKDKISKLKEDTQNYGEV